MKTVSDALRVPRDKFANINELLPTLKNIKIEQEPSKDPGVFTKKELSVIFAAMSEYPFRISQKPTARIVRAKLIQLMASMGKIKQ